MKKIINVLILLSFIIPSAAISGKYGYDVPIQKRVESDLKEKCKLEIKRYKKYVAKYPTIVYYKFMLNIWKTRCNINE